MATTPTPMKMEAKEEAEEMEAGVRVESTPGRSGEFIEKPIHISVGGGQNKNVWELRHYPQTIQNGYGFPHPCCPHKEGPSVLLLSIQYV